MTGEEPDYIRINRANWDERAPAHAASAGYGLQRYVDDPQLLSDTVRFDLPRLGDISGLTGVHLQCHLGTDTLSLARLGARMTGLDFSAPAVQHARDLASRCGADITYVQSDVYAAVEVLGADAFDLVYTGIGALCWLPSITRWADQVVGLLRPGGRLFVREGHPMLWAMDEVAHDGEPRLRFSYFQRDEADVLEHDGTYVDSDRAFTATATHTWNHGLGEVVSALLERGMRITGLAEHDSVPWESIEGRVMVRDEAGEWRLADRPWRLAQSYTLQAVRDR